MFCVYSLVESSVLMSLQLFIFSKRSLKPFISGKSRFHGAVPVSFQNNALLEDPYVNQRYIVVLPETIYHQGGCSDRVLVLNRGKSR